MFRHACRLSAARRDCQPCAAILVSSSAPLHARATLEVIGRAEQSSRAQLWPGGRPVRRRGRHRWSGAVHHQQQQPVRLLWRDGVDHRITLGGVPSQTRLVTGLPSLAAPAGGGRAGGAAIGPHDVEFQGRGNGFVTIGAALDPARRFNDAAHPEFAAVGAQLAGSSGSSRMASGPSRKIYPRSKGRPILTAARWTRTRTACSRCRDGKCSPTPAATRSTRSRPMDLSPTWRSSRTAPLARRHSRRCRRCGTRT